MKKLSYGIVLLVLGAGSMRAVQTPDVASFDVASIKRNTSGEVRTRFETPPGRLNAVNVPLRFLIRQAYRVPDARVLGGPAWMDRDRFDIVATASSGASTDAMRSMLRRLLEARFDLAMHMEPREMPVDAAASPSLD